MQDKAHTYERFDELSPAITPAVLLVMLAAAVGGALAAVAVLPSWVPGMSGSLQGEDAKACWYLARASGFVAYMSLWFSMLLGLLLTSRTARIWPGGPVAFDLHQYTSLLGLAFAIFHGLILLGDSYIGFTLLQVLVPFANQSYEPLAVGIGQLAFYLMALLVASFYVRRRISRQLWRALHFLSFAAFLLALGHAIWSGTDSAAPLASILYWLSGGSVLFLSVYRILAASVSQTASAAARS